MFSPMRRRESSERQREDREEWKKKRKKNGGKAGNIIIGGEREEAGEIRSRVENNIVQLRGTGQRDARPAAFLNPNFRIYHGITNLFSVRSNSSTAVSFAIPSFSVTVFRERLCARIKNARDCYLHGESNSRAIDRRLAIRISRNCKPV